MISYEIKGDKYVFCNEGVYFALTHEQVVEMEKLCYSIKNRSICKYGFDHFGSGYCHKCSKDLDERCNETVRICRAAFDDFNKLENPHISMLTKLTIDHYKNKPVNTV